MLAEELRCVPVHGGRLVVNGGRAFMCRDMPALMPLALAIRFVHHLSVSRDCADSNSNPRRAPLRGDEFGAASTIRIVRGDLTEGGGHRHFGTAMGGRLEATDLDWSYGSGPALRGKAEDLALVLCGRTLPAGRIESESG